jgi:hypothetical protein
MQELTHPTGTCVGSDRAKLSFQISYFGGVVEMRKAMPLVGIISVGLCHLELRVAMTFSHESINFFNPKNISD